jgi:hypothetical protein
LRPSTRTWAGSIDRSSLWRIDVTEGVTRTNSEGRSGGLQRFAAELVERVIQLVVMEGQPVAPTSLVARLRLVTSWTGGTRPCVLEAADWRTRSFIRPEYAAGAGRVRCAPPLSGCSGVGPVEGCLWRAGGKLA